MASFKKISDKDKIEHPKKYSQEEAILRAKKIKVLKIVHEHLLRKANKKAGG